MPRKGCWRFRRLYLCLWKRWIWIVGIGRRIYGRICVQSIRRICWMIWSGGIGSIVWVQSGRIDRIWRIRRTRRISSRINRSWRISRTRRISGTRRISRTRISRIRIRWVCCFWTVLEIRVLRILIRIIRIWCIIWFESIGLIPLKETRMKVVIKGQGINSKA